MLNIRSDGIQIQPLGSALHSRRDLLRVGGTGMMGLSLASLLQMKRAAAEAGAAGAGTADSIILVFLQGGPSHLDLWDPKPDLPDNMVGPFKEISTKLPDVKFTELLPQLAQVNDKFTLIRSMSYTP
ncbi:MAG: DUF1501 domain-containing protein, partial [Planctomycetaceae bacterium]|nr:DUF1501 domain-containing protein [Planctomycetaceae bacterium]